MMNTYMISNKSRITLIGFILAMLITPVAIGADLTVTKTWVQNETLTADDLNNSFNETETAVNTKQDRVTGICAANQSIREINANGTVLCEVDTDTNTTYSAGSGLSLSGTSFSVNPSLAVNSITYNSPKTHYISIPAQAFVSSLGNPVSTSWGNGGAYLTTVANDAMVAPVYLPDGAVITEYYFYYVDNDAATDMSASLQRRTHLGALSNINTLTSSGTPSASAVSKSATLAVTVNNSLYNYSVRVSAFPWPGSEILRIYSVRISYTIATVE